MDNPFKKLADVTDDLRSQKSAQQQATSDTSQWKHSQILSCSPMVIGVLNKLRAAAFPRFETHTKANEKESYYFWGIGYPAEMEGYKYFLAVVEVKPVWSADGELVGLTSSLNLPNTKDLLELGKEFGLSFDGCGATMTGGFEHEATEEALVGALQELLKPAFVQRLLPKMNLHWRD